MIPMIWALPHQPSIKKKNATQSWLQDNLMEVFSSLRFLLPKRPQLQQVDNSNKPNQYIIGPRVFCFCLCSRLLKLLTTVAQMGFHSFIRGLPPLCEPWPLLRRSELSPIVPVMHVDQLLQQDLCALLLLFSSTTDRTFFLPLVLCTCCLALWKFFVLVHPSTQNTIFSLCILFACCFSSSLKHKLLALSLSLFPQQPKQKLGCCSISSQ